MRNTAQHFTVHDYEFELVPKHDCVFEIRSTDGNWKTPVGHVFDMEDGDFIAAAAFSSVTRTETSPVGAAVALLRSII